LIVRRQLIVLILAAAGLVSADALQAQESVIVGQQSTVLVKVGAAALASFKALVAPVYDGGECRMFDDHPTAAKVITIYYPTLPTAHTRISLWFSTEGRLTRYVESRGGSPSPSADLEAMIEAAAAMPSTSIQLDVAENRALAMNRGGAQPSSGVRATIDDFGRDPQFVYLSERIEAVRAACSGGE
jgi:hypothetical protein